MKQVAVFVLSLGVLSACATVLNGQTQYVTIETPGAQSAECELYNEAMRYHVRAGEPNLIMKSDQDLIVDCRAPGDRHKIIKIVPELAPETLANVTNAVVPGVAYDHFSRGLYEYPEIITVDFTGMKPGAYPPPDYMNADMQGGEYGDIEQFGSSTPALSNAETGEQPEIQKIDRSAKSLTDSPFGDRTQPPSSASTSNSDADTGSVYTGGGSYSSGGSSSTQTLDPTEILRFPDQ